MITQQLLGYIKEQLSLGKNKIEITAVLLKVGWKQEEIDNAYKALEQDPNPTVITPTLTSTGTNQLPSLGQMLSESSALIKQRIKSMAGTIILPLLGLIGWGIVTAFISIGLGKINQQTGLITSIVFGVILWIVYIFILSWVITSEFTILSAELVPTTKEALKTGRSEVFSMFLVITILYLVILGGNVLLIIPGIIFAVYYGFAPVILVLEGKKGRNALAQSKVYVNGRGWEVFGKFFMFNLMFYIPALILQILIDIGKYSFLGILASIILFILYVIYVFFSLALIYVFYTHLKNTAPINNPQTSLRGITGWLIWGSVCAILLISLLTFAVINDNYKQIQGRDQQRVADIQSIEVSLNLYYNDHKNYPNNLNSLIPGYVQKSIPQAPIPADGQCTEQENNYQYTPNQDLQGYNLSFCLGQAVQGYQAGPNTASFKK